MLRGYRVLIMNALVAAATAGLAHFSPDTVSEIVGPSWAPMALIALSAANFALRFSTNSPVGKS